MVAPLFDGNASTLSPADRNFANENLTDKNAAVENGKARASRMAKPLALGPRRRAIGNLRLFAARTDFDRLAVAALRQRLSRLRQCRRRRGRFGSAFALPSGADPAGVHSLDGRRFAATVRGNRCNPSAQRKVARQTRDVAGRFRASGSTVGRAIHCRTFEQRQLHSAIRDFAHRGRRLLQSVERIVEWTVGSALRGVSSLPFSPASSLRPRLPAMLPACTRPNSLCLAVPN
jgi:hypothetical protein